MRVASLLLSSVFGLSILSVQAQNYIVNGSFERAPQKKSPPPRLFHCDFSGNAAVFDENLDGWQAFQIQTPDLFWVRQDGSDCPLSLPAPRSGERMIGLIMYLPGLENEHEYDYHEFAVGALAKPLSPGKRYRLSFWTRSDLEIGARHLESLAYRNKGRIRPLLCGNFGFFFLNAAFF